MVAMIGELVDVDFERAATGWRHRARLDMLGTDHRDHLVPGQQRIGGRRANDLPSRKLDRAAVALPGNERAGRSEEHTSELQSLMRISYAVFCLKKQKRHT